MKRWFYNLIRPLLVRSIDPNEDFVCCQCGSPVLRRVLFCSDKCWYAFKSKAALLRPPPPRLILINKDKEQ